MATREIDGLARRSTFIFSGTIDRVGAATMAEVPVDGTTAVVRVEQVFRAPDAVGLLPDQAVTVKLTKRDASKGERALFFANGWLYGKGIAVTEVGRSDADEPDAIRKAVDRAQTRDEERLISERIKQASLIVLGQIGAIRPVRQRSRGLISEHDPQWFVAELGIESVEKGRHPKSRPLRVAFPTSSDVQWYWRPKLQPGQDGVFLLHREKLEGLPTGVLTAPDPRDLQPRHALDHVRGLIQRTG